MKILLLVSVAALSLFLTTFSLADLMSVFKGRAIFIAADNQLTVLPDSPDQALQALSCRFENGTFVAGSSPSIAIPIPGAIDVKIVGNHVYIAISSTENSSATTYAKYDVTACLPDGPFTPYRARADLTSGELVIPCVEVNGSEYNVTMKQRGKSSNWEVDFVGTGCH